MKRIRCHIADHKIRTKAQALEEFWRFNREHNGHRRSDPEKVITVRQIRQCNSGGFDIFYDIPAKYDPLRRGALK